MSRPPCLLSIYAKRYGVSTRAIQRIGVARMTAMTELGREIITIVGRIRVSDEQMEAALARLRQDRREWRKRRRAEA